MEVSAYEQKKLDKALRFKTLAKKHAQKSNERCEVSRRMSDQIPMGQPILIGHHSERSHRAHLKRIDGHMSKAIEHDKTAKYYEQKADNILNNKNIYLEDPEAEGKIEEKLARLKALQQAYKNFNKDWRSHGLEKALENYPGNKERIKGTIDIFCRRFNPVTNREELVDHKGLPSYMLVNLNAKIKRYERKLNTSIEVKKAQDKGDLYNDDFCRAVIEEGRINVYFQGIPCQESRTILKKYPISLKWSPSRACWTRTMSESTGDGYQRVLVTSLGQCKKIYWGQDASNND
jgi:hypothetical protein